jgi:hypothetical protein
LLKKKKTRPWESTTTEDKLRKFQVKKKSDFDWFLGIQVLEILEILDCNGRGDLTVRGIFNNKIVLRFLGFKMFCIAVI